MGHILLLTPGPLTISGEIRAAMLADWGSRDSAFVEMTTRIRRTLPSLLSGASSAKIAVLLQGAGSYAVEAMLTNFVSSRSRVLVGVNGAYGRRAVEICRRSQRPFSVVESNETKPLSVEQIDSLLSADKSISHVFVVHCETTTGLLNPLEEIAQSVAHHGRALLIDAMSSFGALAIEESKIPFMALAASANKCLESAPGVSFVLCDRHALQQTEGVSTSLAFDLLAQQEEFEKTGQWRFTPPTHCVAALEQALSLLEREGGVSARGRRYRQNCQILRQGLCDLELELLLPDALQAPIIVTVKMPENWHFDGLYQGLLKRGFAIYPGKLTQSPSFRVGCIGNLDERHIKAFLNALAETMKEMPGLPSVFAASRRSSGAAQ